MLKALQFRIHGLFARPASDFLVGSDFLCIIPLVSRGWWSQSGWFWYEGPSMSHFICKHIFYTIVMRKNVIRLTLGLQPSGQVWDRSSATYFETVRTGCEFGACSAQPVVLQVFLLGYLQLDCRRDETSTVAKPL